MRLASVTSDGVFAYVQVGCAHVTCKREGDRIVLVAGPDCQLAVSGDPNAVTVAVSSNKLRKTEATVGRDESLSGTTYGQSETAITAVAKTTNTGAAATFAPDRRGLLSNRKAALSSGQTTWAGV